MFKDYAMSVFSMNTASIKNRFPNHSYEELKGLLPFVLDRYVFRTWEEVKEFLFSQHQILSKGKMDNLHVVSGLTEDYQRKTDSFKSTSCVYFADIDDLGTTLNEFIKKIKSLNHNVILYNSASCKQGDIRCRIVFNLNRKVLKQEFLHFWTNLNRMYDNIFDPQTKYLSKTNALPRTFPKPTLNFFGEIKGEPVDVQKIKETYRFIPPEDKLTLPDEYYKYQSKLNDINGKQVSWSNLNDCPFTNTMNVKQKIRYHQFIMHLDGSGRFNSFKSVIGSIVGTAKAMQCNISVSDVIRLLEQIDPHQMAIKPNSKRTSHIDSINDLLLKSA